MSRDTIRIPAPEKLNNRSAFQFVNRLHSLEAASKYVFDFSGTDRAFPFAIVFMQAAIRQFMEKSRAASASSGVLPRFLFEGIDTRRISAHGYLAHVGFFRALGVDIGREPGEASGSDTYVPVTVIRRRDILDHAEDQGLHYGQMVVRHAERLANIFFMAMKGCMADEDLASINKTTTYCIREIIRNAVEHSKAENIFFCGQYYPSLSVVELGIVDEGIGVDASLARIHSVSSIRIALDLATRPGYSGNADKYREDDDWVNTGFGLYTTSRLCSLYPKGQFCIASNGSSLTMERDRTYYIDVPFSGTAVMLKLFVGHGASYKDALETIVSQGEAIAGTETIGSASKMSKVY